MGCTFRMRFYPESTSHFKLKFRDVLSAEDLNRKVHPVLDCNFGMQFPPEVSTGNRIPVFGWRAGCAFSYVSK